MADDTYTSNKRLNTGASEYNALAFIIEGIVKGLVNTAIPVRVDSCTVNSEAGKMKPAGYVSVTPLIRQRSADGKGLDPVSIPQLPFFRLRAGKAAVVLDPQPGDIGFAIFAQQDISNLQQEGTEPVPAGTFRAYDMSDGFYMGGLLSAAPTTWVFLDPAGENIEINAPKDIVLKSGTRISIEAPEIDVNAPLGAEGGGAINMKGASTVTTTAPAIGMNGPFTANDAGGGSSGEMVINGTLKATGNVTAMQNISATSGSVYASHFWGAVN